MPMLVLTVLASGCLDGQPAGPDGRTLAASPDAAQTTIPPAPDPVPTDENGSLIGIVLNDETLPLPGARLALVGPNLLTESDADGRFTMNGIPPGDYGLQVEKLGYQQ